MGTQPSEIKFRKALKNTHLKRMKNDDSKEYLVVFSVIDKMKLFRENWI
jgi:hypothetical protein